MSDFKVEQKVSAGQKTEQDSALTTPPDTSRSGLRDELRRTPTGTAQMSADSIEIVAGQTVVDPHTAMKMYLLGKLTQGQLAHELKKYNDVVADTIIKDGKENQTKVIDYRDVGRASVSNPGGDLKNENPNEQTTNPKDARSAARESRDTSDDKKRDELRKQETKLKNEESVVTLRRLANFTDTQREQKNAHAWRELKRQEEESRDQAINQDPEATSIDKAQARTQTQSKLRGQVTGDEIRKELEKLKSGPSQSSK